MRERGEQEGKNGKQKGIRNTPPKSVRGKTEKEKAKSFLGEQASSSAGLSLWSLSEPALSGQSTHEHQTCPRTHSPATLQSRSPGGSHY